MNGTEEYPDFEYECVSLLCAWRSKDGKPPYNENHMASDRCPSCGCLINQIDFNNSGKWTPKTPIIKEVKKVYIPDKYTILGLFIIILYLSIIIYDASK